MLLLTDRWMNRWNRTEIKALYISIGRAINIKHAVLLAKWNLHKDKRRHLKKTLTQHNLYFLVSLVNLMLKYCCRISHS